MELVQVEKLINEISEGSKNIPDFLLESFDELHTILKDTVEAKSYAKHTERQLDNALKGTDEESMMYWRKEFQKDNDDYIKLNQKLQRNVKLIEQNIY